MRARAGLGKPLTLTVAISTIGRRINQIDLPPPCTGVAFLVLWQSPTGNCPNCLNRSDVRLVQLKGVGLSSSRNAALDLTQSDALLFCDDDMLLDIRGIEMARKLLRRHSHLSFIRGWRAERSQGLRRRKVALNHLNSADICAPELMIRPNDFKARNMRFDPMFGLGAAHELGEEFVFVTDALKAGLKGAAVPIVLGSHPDISTGKRWDTSELYCARQAVLRRVFGRWSSVLRVAYALKHWHQFPTNSDAMRFAFGRPTLGRVQNRSIMSDSPVSDE